MYYITTPQVPRTHQMTLHDLLFGDPKSFITYSSSSFVGATKTITAERISYALRSKVDVNGMIRRLRRFNEDTEHLHKAKRADLYYTFHIPKKSGGLRRIDAPNDDLMDALRRLKTIFEESFFALHHTCAFAYVKGRCTVHAIKRHQNNASKWFGKFDLSDFFGSTTKEFVMNQLSMIFPFSEVIKNDYGREQLELALDLAFLNGGLPQGTPISPLITNVMMIPIDYTLANKLRNFEKQSFVYTRYADDFIISSKYDFDHKKVEQLIIDTLESFSAPFKLNQKKTRYGSSNGSNWNLGLMLNKDNQITVGSARKRQLQTMLRNFHEDLKKGILWDLHDIQIMDGYLNYYRMVEREVIDGMILHFNNKYKTDIRRCIKEALTA